MSIETLLKNVYTFANILNQAGSDAVLKWNPQSLDNAFRWAEYCSQIAEQIKNKPFKEDFLRHIKMMTMHLNPPSCLQLDLDTLENAMSVLRKCLLRNKHLKERQLKQIFDRFCIRKETKNELIQDCGAISREDNTRQIVQDILHLFPNLTVLCSDVGPQATVLLKNLVQLSNVSRPDRFKSYLSSMLDRLSTMDGGPEVIMELLLTTLDVERDGMTDQQGHVERIHNITLAWITSASDKVILQSNKKILFEVSCRHQQFARIYIERLMRWADSLQLSYDLPSTGRLYSWRLPNVETPDRSFDELCSHLSHLCNDKTNIGKILVVDFSSLAKTSHVNVYKDILKKLHI